LGFLLATPLDFSTVFFVALLVMALLLPILLKWHHFFLVASWNAAIIVFFLPGQPSLGTVMSILSLLVFVLNRTMRQKSTALDAKYIKLSLLFLLAVVLITAKATGGISGKALGSESWGGRRYVSVFSAIAGFFALTSQSIPTHRRWLYASLFFLSGITAVISDLIYAAGPGFYFLYFMFPSQLASLQVLSQESVQRFSGFTWGSQVAIFYILMRYGIRGTLDLSHPWRLVAFLSLVAFGTLGGFRSALITVSVVCMTLFVLEGLVVTRYFPIAVMAASLFGVFLVGFMDRLPLAVQRSLSFLPVDVDPIAKMDAVATLDWRFQMWRVMIPEIPKYFFLGKGYAFSASDFLLTQEAIKRGLYTSYEDTLIAGDYHNGPLTLIIPFGIWGVLGFAWFCWASLRALHANYRFGDIAIQNVNRFLYAYFIARLLFYLVFYGQFDLDLSVFTGTIGLSIALNNGICRPTAAPERTLAQSTEAKPDEVALAPSGAP
jgi:hypothetical protein